MPRDVRRKTRSLPTITALEDALPYLKLWSTTLRRTLKRGQVLKAPWRFRVTTQRGGLLLEWAAVAGADGYHVLRSDTGDFSAPLTIPIRGGKQTAYFDSLGGAVKTKFYKLRATSGTLESPQSVLGVLTGLVKGTSIDSTDVTTQPTTASDPLTSDGSQRRVTCVEDIAPVEFPEGATVEEELIAENEWYDLITAQGSRVPAAPGTLIATWTPVEKLQPGDIVDLKDGLDLVESVVERFENSKKVRRIVKPHGYYYVDRVRVHNLKLSEL